jgi:long-chain acyl-CoA synthetase
VLLTAPGAAFEMREIEAHGRRIRAYVNTPQTMREVLDSSRRHGRRDLLVFEGERVSFEQHWRAAHAFGRALVERFDLKKGDRVAVAMRNFPEWSVCAFGALAVGAVFVPLNAWEGGDTLANMLTDSGVRIVVADQERIERLRGRTQATIISARGAGGDVELESLIGRSSDWGLLPDSPAPAPVLSADDAATIFYTSGTTGVAKGALGTHRNLITNLVNTGFRTARAALRRGETAKPNSDPSVRRAQLLPLPLFHVTGFHSALVPAVCNGVTIVLMYKWDVDQALDLIVAERINVLSLVPTLAWQLCERLLERPDVDVSSVDSAGYGGAAAAPALAAAVRAAFPNAFPGQGYGATETSSLAIANSHEDMMAKPDSVGIATPCCDLRIVGADGCDVERGEPGELWVRGPQVVVGYWNRPEDTEAAFGDGWYRTGDIVTMDDEGFVYVKDRIKDMLIRGGENIYCAEIETIIAEHQSVAECAVFGIPDRVLGEVVAAVVRLRLGADLDEGAVRSHVRARLPAHKTPVVVEIVREPLPRNAAGKVVKRDLRARITERSPIGG